MPNSKISTKILTITMTTFALGVMVFIALLSWLLTRDYQSQYDERLIKYTDQTITDFKQGFEQHKRVLIKLVSDIEKNLNSSTDISRYWDNQSKSTLINSRRLLGSSSSVFVPESVHINELLLSELAQTDSAWNNLGELHDQRLLSMSYISTTGFIRTEPSYRARFFPDDFDPRISRYYTQLESQKELPPWDISIDPVNDIYVLIINKPVISNGKTKGVVIGIYELPFDVKTNSHAQAEDFAPTIYLANHDKQRIINPLTEGLFNDKAGVLSQYYKNIHSTLDKNVAVTKPLTQQIINNQAYRFSVNDLQNNGWVLIGAYSNSFLEKLLSRLNFYLSLVLIVGGGALFLVMYVLLKRYISTPLRDLVVATNDISRNNWLYDNPIQRTDEVGVVSDTINVLSKKLRSVLKDQEMTINALDDMNNSLSNMYSTLDAGENMTAIMNSDWEIIYANDNFLKAFSHDALKKAFKTVYQSVFTDLEPDVFDQLISTVNSGETWNNEISLTVGDSETPLYFKEKIFPHKGKAAASGCIIFNAQALLESEQSAEEIHRLAFYDHLTGLQNRTYFKTVMEKELTALERGDRLLALLYIDLDNFKMINDSLGHEAGDTVLIEIGKRLEGCLRKEDAISRLGGDEFAILLTDVDALHYVSIVANKILQALNVPLHLSGQLIPVRASIGVTIAPHDGMESTELMKNADLAMYQAKDKGKNNFRFYTQDMNQQIAQRMELENEIKSAFENHEFVLYYQPKVHLQTGKIHSAEALIRWQLPSGEVRGPMAFIPSAEDTGLIIELGTWVLKTACQQAKTLYKALKQNIVISVNVSARQLMAPDFVNTVAGVLNDVGIDPGLLELEITETMFMSNLDQTISHLQELRALGVRISIDDFGTGYSSLSYIKKLPVDQLKIDRSFIKDLPQDEEDQIITELIVTMAQRLSLEVVAEGVETQEQYDFLNDLGCEYIQGYYFSKPIATDKFLKLIFEQEHNI